GLIIPTGPVGNSPSFVQDADNVIIEVNLSAPKADEGVHDIYIPTDPGEARGETPDHNLHDRLCDTVIKVDPHKARGIVLSEEADIPSPLFDPNEETQQIADNLLKFFEDEVESGRLTKELAPLQSGVGSVANAVLSGMKESKFKDIVVASEVLQDGIFDLIDAGVVKFAAG